jgi:hypothetical protein
MQKKHRTTRLAITLVVLSLFILVTFIASGTASSALRFFFPKAKETDSPAVSTQPPATEPPAAKLPEATELPAPTPVPGQILPEQDRITEVSDLVEAFLKEEGYSYERIEDDDEYTYFTLSFEIAGKFSVIDVEITVYDDIVTFLCYVRDDIPAEKCDAVAAYITRANWVMLYSHFNLDMEDGEVATFSFIPVESVMPGKEELSVLFYDTIWSWEDYGDGLYEVAFEDAVPKEAFEKARAEY